MKVKVEEFADVQMISSDRSLLNQSPEIDYLHWDTTDTQSHVNSPNYDSQVLIIDSEIPTPTGQRNPALASKNSIQSKINSIHKNTLFYLKSGGTIVYLLAERNGIKDVENHDWLTSLNTVRIAEENKRGVCPTADSELVNSYLEFIDVSNYGLNYGDTENMEVLAESTSEDSEAVALAFDDYLDGAGRHKNFKGKVVLLPKPASFEAVGSLLTEKLIQIGKEFSPRGTSPSQRALYEFSEEANQSDEEISSVLHERLSERCLPKYAREEYADAAKTAGQILEEEVREVGPEELSDMTTSTLMKAAFSTDQGPLRFAERDDEQEGVMFLYAGAMQGVRNALSHRTPKEGGDRYLDDLDRKKTRDIIYFVNFLLTLLEDYEEKPDSYNHRRT